MLGSSEVTSYDVRFRLLDVPVRVNPWFWLTMLMISGQGRDLRASLIFVACAFVSILAHEFGHGLSGRFFGCEPTEIVLFGFGGYCSFYDQPRSAWRRIVILAAGPGAGFALYGLIQLGLWLALRGDGRPAWLSSEMFVMAIFYLLYINLVWSILNLFPIWPLDGGRITEVVLQRWRPSQGKRWAHVISLLLAGGISLVSFSGGDYWRGIWFALFAVMNYQILQAMHDEYRFDRGGY